LHFDCEKRKVNTVEKRKIRVLLAKPGLDGHDRGVKVIAFALRDAGMEVVYTGLHQTPEGIVSTAIQEDADVIGLSILSGAHINLTRKIMKSLQSFGVEDKIVIVGGTILEKDVDKLKSFGVKKVFLTGTLTTEVIEFLQKYFNQ
jgi:methylmalonyl-CoA mutase C-terminal domain/subunit